MNAQKMNLSIWYGSSVRVPNFSSYNFKEFAVSSIGLVRSIVHKQIGQRVKVKFQTGGTACADFSNSTIYINRNYIRGQIVQGVNSTSEETIVTIMGILVHEAGHFAYSPETLLPYIDYIKDTTTCLFNQEVARSVANVIEDIYIEAELDRRIPSLTWTLDHLNDLFFTEQDYETHVAKVATMEDAPIEGDGLVDLLNLIIYAKTRATLPLATPEYIADLFEMVRSATIEHEIEDRISLGLLVYNRIMENFKAGQEGEGNEDNQGQADNDSGDGESEGGEGASDNVPDSGTGKPQMGNDKGQGQEDLDKALKTVADKSEGIATAYCQSDGMRMDDSTRPHTTEEIVQKTLKDTETVSLTYIPNDAPCGHDRTTLFGEVALVAGYYTLEVDKRYARLAELGRQRATANRPYGQDMNRGTHIRKLYRIATDQKIFSEVVQMNTYKPMQVAILIDSSSSMETKVYDGSGLSRIEAATSAAVGAAEALLEAHCDVAVYGHTADLHLQNECVIYRAKGFNESAESLAEKVANLRNDSLQGCNRDGYAIGYVGRKFTDQRKRRILIVISDGRPSGSGRYGGMEGTGHSQAEVNKLRKEGVECMCISITKDAGDNNDIIFGAKNNVYNEDSNVIESIIKALLVG